MKHKTERDRTLAFAGVIQALQLVQSTAHGRPYDADAFRATLQSILALDATSVEDVYGGVTGVQKGLRLLQGQLIDGGRKPDADLTRYTVTLLHLERKLSKRPDLLEHLRRGIEQVRHQAGQLGIAHAQVLAALADAYTQTISTLHPRVMVRGDPVRLADTAVANQIRALLLGAMRSAVLWRQCGGTRLGLLFGRKRLASMARQIQLQRTQQ